MNKEIMVCEKVPKRGIGKKVVMLGMVMALVLCMSVGAFAAETSPVSATDWQPVIDALTAQISVSTVVGVLAIVVAACVGLAFMWWGLRKAIRALMSAFKGGKISV